MVSAPRTCRLTLRARASPSGAFLAPTGPCPRSRSGPSFRQKVSPTSSASLRWLTPLNEASPRTNPSPPSWTTIFARLGPTSPVTIAESASSLASLFRSSSESRLAPLRSIASCMSREPTGSNPCDLSDCITCARTAASCGPSNSGTPIRLPVASARIDTSRSAIAAAHRHHGREPGLRGTSSCRPAGPRRPRASAIRRTVARPASDSERRSSVRQLETLVALRPGRRLFFSHCS